MGSISAQVLQFKISLMDSKPLIWRRIQVLDSYSFYDLHVAIQDAMGWKDYHFHQFIIYKGDKRTTQPTYIGIPNGDDVQGTILVSHPQLSERPRHVLGGGERSTSLR